MTEIVSKENNSMKHSGACTTFNLMHIWADHVTCSISCPRNSLLMLKVLSQRFTRRFLRRITSLRKAPVDDIDFGILLLYRHLAGLQTSLYFSNYKSDHHAISLTLPLVAISAILITSWISISTVTLGFPVLSASG